MTRILLALRPINLATLDLSAWLEDYGNAAVVLPAPVVTSIAPDEGAEAGGTTITITGTGFVSGCTVTVGGDAATGVTFNSATEIECDVPAGTGVADVVVTNPDAQTSGASGEGLFTYTETDYLATLPLTAYLRNYAGTPWVGTASAGTSGSYNWGDGVEPGVGANFGTHPSAHMDGATSESLVPASGQTVNDSFNIAAYTIHLVAEFDSFSAPTTVYFEKQILGDAGANRAVNITSAGLTVWHDPYSRDDANRVPILCLTGVKYCIQAVFDGVSNNLKYRVNGLDANGDPGWEVVGPCDDGAGGGSTLRIGCGYDAADNMDGRLALVALSDTAFDDATMDLMLADAIANYGVPS